MSAANGGSLKRLVRCQQCSGFGNVITIHGKTICKCDLCAGTGKIGEKQIAWRIRGGQIKDRRIEAKLQLRQAARLLGVDASNLSKMERGVIAPVAYEYPPNASLDRPAASAGTVGGVVRASGGSDAT